MADKTRVAMLGLGVMGAGMAGQLLGKGFDVTVYNRSPGRADALRAQGAKVAITPREAAENAMVVISMLADDTASRVVWMGPDGALSGVARGTVLIESSTASVGWTHELSEAAIARGCEMLDAPVTGTKIHAESAQLLFLVGGWEQTLSRARPVLAAMSRGIMHLGPVGSGALIKLINNFMSGVQLVATAEALALIERTDLDVAMALSVLTDGAPGSPLVKVTSKRMTDRDFTANFQLKLMAKDLKYAIAEAQKVSLDLTTASAALARMQMADAAGLGNQDFSAVVELLRKKA